MKLIAAACCAIMFATGAQASCYQQLKQHLPVAGTVIFGEIHGSAEIPQFVVDCAREFAANNEAVRVLLEFPASDNPIVEQFLRGEIGEEDLTRRWHWQAQDGRASLAMLRLVRDLKAARIGVSGFDISAREPDRDKGMMRNFMSMYSPTGYSLILVGNVHASRVRGTHWDPAFIPFAKYLLDNGVDLVALNARYPAGSAWNCSPNCGIRSLISNDTGERAAGGGAVVFADDDPAYSGYFRVSSVTASRPVHEK
jgi:hypothetical protein